MYWRGHVGIALLAYAPVAGAVRVAGEPELTVLGAAVAVTFATLPDLDHRLPVAHRGPTHTIAFALTAGVLVALAAAIVFPVGDGTAPATAAGTALPPWTPGFVGGIATLSLCSHVAGDAITPMGIWPLRPFRGWHVTLDLTPAANPRANRLFLGAGVAALALSVALTL
ncbi:metal-dependent hydrolase [Halorubrum lacusprofundi]|jgi:inner membrane protein|uniref:Membrane-bound metal-dependent hydrolase n=1 Tax=Halorubrum lacusprofundi (strain ATCC 49239 / DSM 5036 / JCM 8891 / ACAM 34) TaxID=416348 RepID=B9LTN1_HALLT|nr:metal-dependent hydrolase [Halorubrum lacusprofundi]ACM56165.1 membrane-bound metal-dependent hydrolase [Halorubrum lacusprofundi ATCC 49239]MCG1005524.1 metal-dependent hydrolase [Halorubrum lacusprofundi]